MDYPYNMKKIIGVVHLLPLPGSVGYDGNLNTVIDRALDDAKKLRDGGVHGIIVENFHDVPFFKDNIPPETLSAFTLIASKIKEANSNLFLGINVLRNDAISALIIAHTVGADFIRINIPIGAAITPSGIIEGKIGEVARKKKELSAENIAFYEDVMVKHAWQFNDYSIEDVAVETEKRGLADVIIVSGKATGKETDVEDVKRVKRVVKVPVYIGSGITLDNLKDFLPYADGFIVGTYFERDGISGNPVAPERVKQFMEHFESIL